MPLTGAFHTFPVRLVVSTKAILFQEPIAARRLKKFLRKGIFHFILQEVLSVPDPVFQC
jgi:hypothetical protein